jgi:hypothetical protein
MKASFSFHECEQWLSHMYINTIQPCFWEHASE